MGEIFLRESDWVDTNVPHQLAHHAHMFMLHTSGRDFPFLAQDSVVRDAWMSAMHAAIESVKKCPAIYTFRRGYTDDFTTSVSTDQNESPVTPSTFRFSDINSIWDPPV